MCVYIYIRSLLFPFTFSLHDGFPLPVKYTLTATYSAYIYILKKQRAPRQWLLRLQQGRWRWWNVSACTIFRRLQKEPHVTQLPSIERKFTIGIHKIIAIMVWWFYCGDSIHINLFFAQKSCKFSLNSIVKTITICKNFIFSTFKCNNLGISIVW